MRKSLMLLLASTLIISGCATKKQLVPTGGSKSDGTVRMSYSYGMFESPVVDPQQGMNAAKARCAAWDIQEPSLLVDSLLNVHNRLHLVVCKHL
ncbi:Uncharacterised protein [Escherichia coli]|nr:Uncharacterised protein [Escherichia coli]